MLVVQLFVPSYISHRLWHKYLSITIQIYHIPPIHYAIELGKQINAPILAEHQNVFGTN